MDCGGITNAFGLILLITFIILALKAAESRES